MTHIRYKPGLIRQHTGRSVYLTVRGEVISVTVLFLNIILTEGFAERRTYRSAAFINRVDKIIAVSGVSERRHGKALHAVLGKDINIRILHRAAQKILRGALDIMVGQGQRQFPKRCFRVREEV